MNFAHTDTQKILVEGVGSFLRNTDRREGVTCSICAEPVPSQARQCWQCRDQQQTWPDGLADLVVPVSYGGHNRQSKQLLYGYKDSAAASEGDERRLWMLLLLGVTNALHRRCIEATAGEPVGGWTVVPSTSGRPDHPLPGLAREALGPHGHIPASPAAVQPANAREITEHRFDLGEPAAAADRHVLLVIDDTWTTGAHAQSLAISLRRAGASRVSVLVLARWLNPQWHSTESYLKENPRTDFDPELCPVTGGDCPV